ncbi:MAG TPA: hypothetical protein VG056_08860 [Pirellulales bacterium]|jgi:hypothetical protein|nr:hypothetical protein [Pirellulales bacterium]
MNRIVVDDSLSTKLRDMAEPCEVFDPSGNRLGYFRPEADVKLYEGYECPLSDEELDEIERSPGGRPLAEIMRDLKAGK